MRENAFCSIAGRGTAEALPSGPMNECAMRAVLVRVQRGFNHPASIAGASEGSGFGLGIGRGANGLGFVSIFLGRARLQQAANRVPNVIRWPDVLTDAPAAKEPHEWPVSG